MAMSRTIMDPVRTSPTRTVASNDRSGIGGAAGGPCGAVLAAA
jgi:hypothetical protein